MLKDFHIAPKLPDQDEIENRSLRLLLKSVGDGVLVSATQLETDESDSKMGDWQIHICARGFDEVLRQLEYTQYGELLSHVPTVVETVYQNAADIGQPS